MKDLLSEGHMCWLFMHCKMKVSLGQICCSVGISHLSFGDKVGHDGGVAELGGQMNAAAPLAVNQRGVCAVFHELHHHG